MNTRNHGIPNIESWISRRTHTAPLDTGQLREYQFSQIRETLAWVLEKSPFYGDRLSGVHPQTIRKASDFSLLPFTTPKDLQDEGHRMLCLSQSHIERVVTLMTSGTTGTAKRVFFTGEDQALSVDFFKEGMGSFTTPGDRVLILMPGPHPGSIGDLLGKALPSNKTVPLPHGFVTNPMKTLSIMEQEEVNCLIGVPNQILALAQIYKALEQHQLPCLNKVLLSSDYISPALASRVASTWHCETRGYYAMTELGYGGGIECAYHQGYHLYEGDFFIEIINPDTGILQPDGEWGEVVITTLTRKGMPFIRYRTGDISRIIPGVCHCGSSLRRLDAIRLRKDTLFPIRGGGRLCLADLDDALLDLPGLLDFHPSLSESAEGTRLILELDTFGTSLPEREYRERITAIAGIRDAFQSGRFKLELHYKSYGPAYMPRLGKRKIETTAPFVPQ